jgi:hypothetical protein
MRRILHDSEEVHYNVEYLCEDSWQTWKSDTSLEQARSIALTLKEVCDEKARILEFRTTKMISVVT